MRRLLVLTAIMLLAIAACGDDDGDSEEASEANGDDAVATEVSDESSEADEQVDETEPTPEPEPTATAEEDPEPTEQTEPEATEAPDESAAEDETPDEEAPDDSDGSSGGSSVEVAQYDYFVSSSNMLFLFGEIENTGEGHAVVREVLITLRDEGGSVVDSSSAFSYISLLEADSSAPFYHSFSETGDNFAEVEIDVDVVDASDEELADYNRYYDFETLQADWRAGDFDNSIVGEIENVGEETANFVEVFAAGYNSEGAILFVQTAFAERERVEPGQTSPYTVSYIDSSIEEPAEIRVITQSWIADD